MVRGGKTFSLAMSSALLGYCKYSIWFSWAFLEPTSALNEPRRIQDHRLILHSCFCSGWLENHRGSKLWANRWEISYHYFLASYRKWCQCRAWISYPWVWRQHQWLYICRAPLFVTLCLRTGSISNTKTVNPFGRAHGGPGDSERHVGDLGNFKTDAAGNSKGTMKDNLVKLIGLESVLGVRYILRWTIIWL